MSEKTEAIQLSRRFHRLEPSGIKTVDIKWPKSLVELGECVRLDYLTDKWDLKKRIYFHEFGEDTKVYAVPRKQANGQNMIVIIGDFEFTQDGIEG